jgi:uncharacterized protein (TIGR02246 family)
MTMSDKTEETRKVIDRVYDAYLAGNAEGMIAEMAEDAVVTFAGHGTFRGKDEIRPYMTWAGPQLTDLKFNVLAKIVDGERAAVPWHETARTARGEPWESIGCDIYRLERGKIVEMTVLGETEKVVRLLEPWPPVE